jgi:crooked neck
MEAVDRQEDQMITPKQTIQDLEELEDYRLKKRKYFEDRIRRNRYIIGTWLR